MDQNSIHSSQNYSATPTRVISPLKKVQVVYYLSYRGGLLEQPHLLDISLSSSTGLCLRDVKTRLASLRGGLMSSSFSWSYKRGYKEGFVWQDLESDTDLIFPTHNGSEYVMKGCRIESSCTVQQIPASLQNMLHSLRGNVHDISTAMQPASRLTEFPAPSTATQLSNAINLVAMDDHANNKMVIGNPSNASFHRCDDDITFNLGVIEGLEHLRLAKAIDLNYDYAESQASTSLNHSHIAMEQNKKNIENLRLSKRPSPSKLHLIIDREPYDSTEFSVIKKDKGDSGASLNPSLYVRADVATQTGEDDDTPKIIDEYGKGCLPDFYHADNLPCLKSREGSFFKQRMSLQSALIELCREEISPPPCSTSSSSTTTSAHSASSSNAISGSVDQLHKLNLDKSSCLANDHSLQEMEILLPSRVCSDQETLLNEEGTMATKSPVNSDRQGRETPSLSVEFKENLSSDAVDDDICKNPNSALNSSKIKPRVMDLCSNSGRFLHLVSCGRGLEVITPSDRRIQRTPNVCEEASGRQQPSLFNANSDEYSCSDLAPINVNAESGAETDVDSCLPIAANNVPGKMLCDGDSSLVALSPQEYSNSSRKKLWHLIRGWVYFHNEKKRNLKSTSISSNSSAVHEDAYACLDLFKKHVANSSTDHGINAEDSSSQRRLIRVGSTDYSSNSYQRSSSYGTNPSTNFTNEWLASPLQRPQIGSRGSSNGGGESNHLAWRSSFPVYSMDTCSAKQGSPLTLQKAKNNGRWR